MPDHCAVITGVSKGLGEALAATLLERDYEVVGIGRSAAPSLASSKFRLVIADLGQTSALDAVVAPLFAELATRPLASIVVINNAALAGPAGTIGMLDADEASNALAVNLIAPLIVANAFVRAFRGIDAQCRLINVSSGAAAHPIPGAGVYCMAKAGLEMLARTIAAEATAENLTAITIRPGVIDTPMQVFMRSQPEAKLPAVDMFRGFHEGGQLVAPNVTAAKIVERLVMARVEDGRTYTYQDL